MRAIDVEWAPLMQVVNGVYLTLATADMAQCVQKHQRVTSEFHIDQVKSFLPAFELLPLNLQHDKPRGATPMQAKWIQLDLSFTHSLNAQTICML